MNLSHKSDQPRTADPVYRKLHRAFLALCILLAPLTISLWFTLCPTGAADAGCPDRGSSLAVFTAFQTMNPQLMQVFLLLNLVIPYVWPLSYLGLFLLATKRSPWWATLGIACGWAGSIPWGLFTAQMATLDVMAQMGPNQLFVSIENHFYSNWMISAFALGWFFHLPSYVFMGIALLRARAIPLWAAWLIIVSVPLMGPIAYTPGTNLGLLQVLGFVLVFVGSIPAALAMLNLSNVKTPIHAGEEPAPARLQWARKKN